MIQLKIKTEFSFGETYAPIKRVIERLAELKCKAAGIVDNASTWGHVEWFNACRAAGIQPLLGVELVVSDMDDSSPRMWFLATNNVSELYHWTSMAHRQRVKTKRGALPRLYRADVESMPASILKFAGDITDGSFLKDVGAYLDISPASKVLNITKQGIAKRYKLPIVNVSDNSFSSPDDKQVFEIIGSGVKPSPQYIIELKPTATERRIVKACANLELPQAPMVRMKGNLSKLCRDGIKKRGMEWNAEYEKRLKHELKMIKEKDYESYFLVVADMVQYAKQHMLVGPSRGSAAGSLVCYLTEITEIDPLPPGLFFERFIDVTRSDLPDIDLDFPDAKRHMVFEYMANKYGSENVSHIGTISRYKPRSALVETCKRIGIPPQATTQVKMSIIERSSADARASNCLEDTLTTTPAGKQLVSMYPAVTLATNIEGHASHTGVHAAGLLVCNEPIEKFATVTEDGIAQVEKGSAEKLGLLKIDVLGLRTLNILEDAGTDVDWYRLPIDDDKTFDIFNRELLCGIFQFEGEAMRTVARYIKFTSIDQIDAVTALARPGPFGGGVTQKYIKRLNGEKYEDLHPAVAKIMDKTFGLPIYQEQTLAMVREIGKFSWGETSTIRKAMSKRLGEEFFSKFRKRFVQGAATQGISESDAVETWKLINYMGAWQMNKAHTYSYAVISYWTAYLKAHYPLKFTAACLRNAKDEESAISLLREMHELGIEYVPFDPQLSEEDWSIKDNKLIGGMQSLKGFGAAKAKKFIEARNKGELTQSMIDKALEAENPFSDIYPIQTKYGDWYENPSQHGVLGKIHRLCEFEDEPEDGSYVFIGTILHKNPRDINEEVYVKRRDGKRLGGPQDFLDLRLKDDTSSIYARIGRYQYKKIGVELMDTVPVGADLLVRAKFFGGRRFAFIQKWKRIDT